MEQSGCHDIFRVSFCSKSDQKEGSLTQDMDVKVTNKTTKHAFPSKSEFVMPTGYLPDLASFAVQI